MKVIVGLALTLASLALAASVEVTPVQKATQMLQTMLKKTKYAKGLENHRFIGFVQFCNATKGDKAKLIQEGLLQVSSLKAIIQKATNDQSDLVVLINKQEKKIIKFQYSAKKAARIRVLEHADYLKKDQDLHESLNALTGALTSIKANNADRVAQSGTVSSFLQTVSALNQTPEDAKGAIQTFLQDEDAALNQTPEGPIQTFLQDEDAQSGPEEKLTIYKSKTSPILNMLTKLEREFKDDKVKCKAKEVAQKLAATTFQLETKDSITFAYQQIKQMTSNKAALYKDQLDKEGDLKEVSAVLKNDRQYRAKLVVRCKDKAVAFKARTKMRADEITALTKAVAIIGGGAVVKANTHARPHIKEGRSFAQLRSSVMYPDQRRVIEFLNTESERLASHELSGLALEVVDSQRSLADPFKKVKQLITALMNRMQAEMLAGASHKAWCDTELHRNKVSRTDKSEQISKLTTSIESLTADIAKLGSDIIKKGKELASIEASVADFTKKRNDESASNAAAIVDAKAGQKAIAQAVLVLKTFYGNAAKATKLLEKPNKVFKDPKTFDKSYKGAQGAGSAVVGMLEIIQTDFANLEKNTNKQEFDAVVAYRNFMDDSLVSAAILKTDIKHKNAKVVSKQGELTTAQDSLKVTQSILKGVLTAFSSLDATCNKKPMSYAEKKARREDEISSLKKALEIIAPKDYSNKGGWGVGT